MDLLAETLYQFAIVIVVFLVLTLLGGFTYNLVKNGYFKFINLKDYLPEDEIHSLKQIFYLIMMALCVVNIFYAIVGEGMVFLYSFVIFSFSLTTIPVTVWRRDAGMTTVLRFFKKRPSP